MMTCAFSQHGADRGLPVRSKASPKGVRGAPQPVLGHVAAHVHRCMPMRASPRDARGPTSPGGGGDGPGGADGAGGSRGGGGGGGGGGDGDNHGGGGCPQPSSGGLLQGWAARTAYDPEFPVKVLMEQVIGVGATALGDMSSRPNWGLAELDFVFSTLVVGSLMNFSIVYLLAPTAAGAAAGTAGGGFLARAMSDSTLRAWGAPGGNMFEAGSFSPAARLLNFAYKGMVFASIGFVAGLAGTALSNGLILLRKHLDPSFKVANEQPHVVANAGTWALHMGLSSNLRYQVLGGVDPYVAALLPLPWCRFYQAGIRALNNVLGGVSFVTLARVLGVQKTSSPSASCCSSSAATDSGSQAAAALATVTGGKATSDVKATK